MTNVGSETPTENPTQKTKLRGNKETDEVP